MGLRFTDEQIRRHAADLGLTAEDGSVPQSARNRVAASLATQNIDKTDRTPGEPLTIRTEIYYRGRLIGASSQQVPIPEG